VDPFVEHRGGGRNAFGVLEWGGCGLTNGDGTVLWPKEQVGGNTACFCVRHRLCMFVCVSAWFVRGKWAVVA
jgi:hypothetical protein